MWWPEMANRNRKYSTTQLQGKNLKRDNGNWNAMATLEWSEPDRKEVKRREINSGSKAGSKSLECICSSIIRITWFIYLFELNCAAAAAAAALPIFQIAYLTNSLGGAGNPRHLSTGQPTINWIWRPTGSRFVNWLIRLNCIAFNSIRILQTEKTEETERIGVH